MAAPQITELFKFNPEDHVIIDIEDHNNSFNIFIETGGNSTLFRTPDGAIWSITIHYDKNKKLAQEFNRDYIPPDLCNNFGFPIHDKQYLSSSSALKERSFDSNIFDECEISLFKFLLGDKYLVATKLNDPDHPVCFIDTIEKYKKFYELFVTINNRNCCVDWKNIYKYFHSFILYKTFCSLDLARWFDHCEITINFKPNSDLVVIQLLSKIEIDHIYIINEKKEILHEIIDYIKSNLMGSNHDMLQLFRLLPSQDSIKVESIHDTENLSSNRPSLSIGSINLTYLAKTRLLSYVLQNIEDISNIEDFNKIVESINLSCKILHGIDFDILNYDDIESITDGYHAFEVILSS